MYTITVNLLVAYSNVKSSSEYQRNVIVILISHNIVLKMLIYFLKEYEML